MIMPTINPPHRFSPAWGKRNPTPAQALAELAGALAHNWFYTRRELKRAHCEFLQNYYTQQRDVLQRVLAEAVHPANTRPLIVRALRKQMQYWRAYYSEADHFSGTINP